MHTKGFKVPDLSRIDIASLVLEKSSSDRIKPVACEMTLTFQCWKVHKTLNKAKVPRYA